MKGKRQATEIMVLQKDTDNSMDRDSKQRGSLKENVKSNTSTQNQKEAAGTSCAFIGD